MRSSPVARSPGISRRLLKVRVATMTSEQHRRPIPGSTISRRTRSGTAPRGHLGAAGNSIGASRARTATTVCRRALCLRAARQLRVRGGGPARPAVRQTGCSDRADLHCVAPSSAASPLSATRARQTAPARWSMLSSDRSGAGPRAEWRDAPFHERLSEPPHDNSLPWLSMAPTLHEHRTEATRRHATAHPPRRAVAGVHARPTPVTHARGPQSSC